MGLFYNGKDGEESQNEKKKKKKRKPKNRIKASKKN